MRDLERRRRGLIFNILIFPPVIALAGFLIWSLRPLILPIIIGVLLAYLFRPLRSAFKYRWLPNGVRVALIFTILTLGLLGGSRFIQNNIPNEKEKIEILVRLKYKLNERYNRIMEIDPTTGKGNQLYDLISKDLNPLRESLNRTLELSDTQRDKFLHFVDGMDGFEPVPEKYYQYYLANTKHREPAAKTEAGKVAITAAPAATTHVDSQSLVKTLIGILSVWFLLPIVFIVFLMDDGAIPQFFIRMVPNRYFELALSVQEEVDGAIGKYLRGLSMECGLVGVTMAMGLFIVGVAPSMAILIGLLAGLATSIPLVGPVVGLTLGMVYALIAEEINPILPFVNLDNLVIAVLIVNGITITLDNLIYQPVVLGSAVNLHPLAVILGIMGGSMLFGMAGVLLAIPTIVVTKAIVQHTFRGLRDYRII